MIKRMVNTFVADLFCLAIPYMIFEVETFIYLLGVLLLTNINKINYQQKINNQKINEIAEYCNSKEKNM